MCIRYDVIKDAIRYLQVGISGHEEEVIVNELLADLLVHASEGVVAAGEISSELGEGVAGHLLDSKPLLLGDSGGKAESLDAAEAVDPDLQQEDQEKALLAALSSLESENRASLETDDYETALGRLAELREPVDAFFDHVMVNAEDPALRNNRLLLLNRLRAQFLAIADISLLAV